MHHKAASLVSPEIYGEFILPYEKKLIDSIHGLGAYVKLHICGNITNIMKYIANSGADIVDIDWMVDFRKAVKAFEGSSSVCGNFDPVRILLEGSVEEVKSEVRKCIAAADSTTFLAAGCEVPKYTPYENLRAVAEAIAEAGSR